ncbi:hypothetical protein [Paenibacillus antarcticus]|nr:hypothetical protein [Paenibacillus antarcticus]
MAKLVAQSIIDGKTDYTVAITKRPDLKIGIDSYLTGQGRADLIG